MDMLKNIKNSNLMFNNYFEIPEIVYNISDLLEIFNLNNEEWAIYGKNPYKSLHTKYVKELKCISDQFNLDVIENIKFFKTLPYGSVSPHTDKRNVAVNIPIIVNDDMYVTFYVKRESEVKESPSLHYNKESFKTKAKKYKPTTISETLYLKKTTCIRTDVPHSVTNNSEQDRILLSISVKDKYDDFTTMKDLYLSGDLLNVYLWFRLYYRA